MNTEKATRDSEIAPPPCTHTTPDQSAATSRTSPQHKDTYHLIGWTVGVLLALVVASGIVHGVFPDMATLGVMMPVMLGSALAAMASLV